MAPRTPSSSDLDFDEGADTSSADEGSDAAEFLAGPRMDGQDPQMAPAASACEGFGGDYHAGAADVFIPHVRFTFLGFPPERLLNPPQPRSRSQPAGCTFDRYARDVHTLMFKTEALPSRARAASGAAAPQMLSSPAGRSSTSSLPSIGPDNASSMATEEMSTEAEESSMLTDAGSEDESYLSQTQLEGEDASAALASQEPLEELLLRVPRDEEGNPTSLGSLRHGLGDCRPCAYFGSAQRPCLNGVRCQFCHLPHSPKRRIRLCRRKRLEMRAAVEAVVAGAGEEGVTAPPRFVPISWSGL